MGEPTAAGEIRTVEILGIPVSSVSIQQAVAWILDRVRSGRPAYITCTGMHGIMEAYWSREIARVHHRADLVVPDGMPLVWLSHYCGQRHVTRVYGPDLLTAVCDADVKTGAGLRHFFYGGAEGVPQALGDTLQTRYPGLQVAGAYSPPFRALTPDEDRDVIARLKAADPDIVWVGLSTPKQEQWMAGHAAALGRPVLIGVGAAFDFHTGRLKQAPPWMQRSGLEWAFRLGVEPRRLWKRYINNLPLFLILVLRQMVITGIRGNRRSSSSASASGGRTG